MSATNKTHGMDGELVEPDWQPLTMAEIRTLLRQFPEVGEPVSIVSTSPRPFSAAGVVRTTKQCIFIKRHHRLVRDREGLLEEHRFIAHLLAHGAPVPFVFHSARDETAIELDDWSYEVHEAPQGTDIYEQAPSWTPFRSMAHAHSAGRALARLHLAAQGFDAPRRKPRPLVASFTIFAADDAKSEAGHYLLARPALAHNAAVINCTNEALQLLESFHAELQSLLPALRPLWTHNDLHASNLLWSDGGDDARATAIIDFGLADCTYAVHDIAHAIERNIVEWITLGKDLDHPEVVPVYLDHLDALLDGYESVRPLSDAELAALAPMAALCHAEFALSEADYFLGVLRSQEKARMAYYGWLVKHARWFLGSEGSRLLNVLRRRNHARQKHRAAAP